MCGDNDSQMLDHGQLQAEVDGVGNPNGESGETPVSGSVSGGGHNLKTQEGSASGLDGDLKILPLMGHWLVFDRSSTVTVVNGLPTVSLVLDSYGTEFGRCLDAPAQVILPEGSTSIRVRDATGPYGSKGWISYTIGDKGSTVRIDFECPMAQDNQVTASPTSHATVLSFSPSGPLHAEVRIR